MSLSPEFEQTAIPLPKISPEVKVLVDALNQSKCGHDAAIAFDALLVQIVQHNLTVAHVIEWGDRKSRAFELLHNDNFTNIFKDDDGLYYYSFWEEIDTYQSEAEVHELWECRVNDCLTSISHERTHLWLEGEYIP